MLCLYHIFMEEIYQDFDENTMLDAIKKSRTYEEFRVVCDITNNACIITRDEYEHFKDVYRRLIDGKYVDVSGLCL